MSQVDEQIEQRRQHLEAIAALGVPHVSAPIRSNRHDRGAGDGARREERRNTRSRTDPDGDGRADSGDPQLRQGEFPGALRRPASRAGVHSPGCGGRARLPDLQAAGLRRSRRRRGPPVSHADGRADRLGDAARVPRQMPPAAPRKVAWPAGCGDSLSAAVPRSDRQSGRAPGLRSAREGGFDHSKVSRRSRAFSKSKHRSCSR